jgi:16S rRNA (cytosine967-C5)-methyltransferase
MQISPARRAAFEILRRVSDESAYSSVLLARPDAELNPKDRGLCHELVLGVLQRQLWLDRTIEHFAGRKTGTLDLPVLIALRLGLYQLRFLSRVPASAAINESVNLVKAARVKSAASFVNAVLRQATREPDYDPTAKVSEAIEKLSIETSHPRWLIERWTEQFGADEAANIARANNKQPVIAFRFTPKALFGKGKFPAEMVEKLRTAGAELIESAVAPGAWRLVQHKSAERDVGEPRTGMPALLRSLADEGLVYFQDEGSQLVAELMDVRDRDTVLDVCAAPGSKSTLMSAIAPASTIVAAELYEHRMRAMKRLAAQQQATNVRFVIHDATNELPFAPQSFDRVLVDAPCSGTGTLRHNPEIRWRLQPNDVRELREKQTLILDNAKRVVKKGGTLLYSTCSLEIEENEDLVADFLHREGEFEVSPLLAPRGLRSKSGALRTWPHRDDVDGFFAASFRRKY